MRKAARILSMASITATFAAIAAAQTFGAPQSDNAKIRLADIIQLIEEMDPAQFVLPENDQTLHFAISDGGLGTMAKGQTGSDPGAGAFMLEAMSGAALVQDYSPTGGPDCDPEAEEPLIIYYGFFADEDASLVSVNAAARLGAIIATGRAVRYRPGPGFCDDKAYTSDPAQPAVLHVPFSLFGQSPRNFQAMQAEYDGKPAQAMFATSGLSARMVGYSDARMFGQSSAVSELGTAGGMGQAALAQALAENPQAAEALSQLPGGVAGIGGDGSIQMDLSTLPMSQIAGSNTAYTYAQIRFAYQGGAMTPGEWLHDLQQAIRLEGVSAESSPTTPNGGGLQD